MDGLEIFILRIRLGWSQKRLAYEIGVSTSLISGMECGNIKVSNRTKKQIEQLKETLKENIK